MKHLLTFALFISLTVSAIAQSNFARRQAFNAPPQPIYVHPQTRLEIPMMIGNYWFESGKLTLDRVNGTELEFKSFGPHKSALTIFMGRTSTNSLQSIIKLSLAELKLMKQQGKFTNVDMTPVQKINPVAYRYGGTMEVPIPDDAPNVARLRSYVLFISVNGYIFKALVASEEDDPKHAANCKVVEKALLNLVAEHLRKTKGR